MTAPSEETRAQPVEVTCPGCFHPREWDVAGVCPICHYRAGLEGRSAALLPVGTQLKGYVVGEKLGQGGFGITYRGFDVTLKMKVAIKEYYPSELVGRSTDRKTVVLNARDHEDLFRYGLRTFLQEAQTVAQLRHPHLVRVLSYFELNDTAYLVMDYYEGEDLARHLKRPKVGIQMPWQRALKLLLPVLDGLQKVHQAGFMHRDLKPGNLYLTQDDELIVLDFGSARQVTGAHTRSLLIFSEGYAPYEQYLQGHLNRQGPWTDVYGAAATLYFMLTARRLPSAMERKQNELLRQPDPLQPARHWVPDAPEALDAALRRALAVEPDQRFQSMAEFKRPLEAVLTAEEPTRLQPSPQPKAAPEPPIKPPPEPQVAPEPPIKPPPEPQVAPEPPQSKAVPEPPKASPKPNVAPERSTPPKQRTARVALVVIGLAGLGGWFWWKFGVSPPPVPLAVVAPSVVTPPVVELPPTVVPPVAEPRAYLTIKPTPATAQIRIMNIGPAYRDGIELTPGDFDLEVSAPGYQTYRGWRTLVAGVQEVVIVLQPNPPVSLPVAPVAPPPTAADIARQKELDLQLAVVKKLLEARKIPAARRALEDAKAADQEGRVETFRREQTTVMQATALLFLEQGQRTLAERVLNDLKQWDPQSPEYQALRERLARER